MEKTIEQELAELPTDGAKLEDIEKEEQEKENSEGSQPEEKHEEEEKEEEKQEDDEEKEEDIPFHKHPRFKALVEEKNSYKEELAKLREDMESKISEIKESHSTDTKIPDWFSELFGENEAAWNKYQAYDKETRAELKREIREEFEKESKEKQDQGEKWNSWIDDQIQLLKDDGCKFEKNELMKVMMDYKPSDDEGNLDFKKGYEIMNLLKKKNPESTKQRKEIVNEDNKTKSEPGEKKYFTPEDMQGRGWEGMAN